VLKTDRFGTEQTEAPATMEQVYVLKLEGDRYYVGKSSDVAKRVKEHATGKGAGYTKLYKPTQVLEVRPLKTPQDENNLTREYMTKYGVNNVRGGSYTQIALAPEVKQVLEQEIRGNTDACFTCGKKGHFASKCTSESEEWWCEFCTKTFQTYGACEAHEAQCGGQLERHSTECSRCGRTGHTKSECYARSHDDGRSLATKSAKPTGTCYRCGRAGHYSPDCYAGTHKKGYDLDSDSDDSVEITL
jgi:predicted GIY-YIG superfamily endonuclease